MTSFSFHCDLTMGPLQTQIKEREAKSFLEELIPDNKGGKNES